MAEDPEYLRMSLVAPAAKGKETPRVNLEPSQAKGGFGHNTVDDIAKVSCPSTNMRCYYTVITQIRHFVFRIEEGGLIPALQKLNTQLKNVSVRVSTPYVAEGTPKSVWAS